MALAECTLETEWIFPEAAALSLGYWVIDKVVWRVTRTKLFFLLVGMACLGTAIQLWSTLPLTVNVGFIFIAAGVLLHVSHCTIYPIISAGILPLVIGKGSWFYPVVVALLALLLCIGQWLMELRRLRTKIEYQPTSDSSKEAARRWLPLLLIVITVT